MVLVHPDAASYEMTARYAVRARIIKLLPQWDSAQPTRDWAHSGHCSLPCDGNGTSRLYENSDTGCYLKSGRLAAYSLTYDYLIRHDSLLKPAAAPHPCFPTAALCLHEADLPLQSLMEIFMPMAPLAFHVDLPDAILPLSLIQALQLEHVSDAFLTSLDIRGLAHSMGPHDTVTIARCGSTVRVLLV